MQFHHFDIDAFLRDYWQQRPLLIKNPWDRWDNPLAPDELAGLACEEGVEARLIRQSQESGGDQWRLEHGPFDESRFSALGERHWTLLVQAVDHVVPDVAALIEPFRFVPNWRIDDVMVSYAADDAGVGPHFDQYDVFLIQGLGRRRWQVGAKCDDASVTIAHDDLCLLADFKPSEEWILEPGDILYLPPGYAHNGVALGGDCMTYSIGFRAPSRSELIAHWCDDVLGRLGEDDRYADPALQAQANPGEISGSALAALQAMVTEKLQDRDAFARWFGQYNSTPKYPDSDWEPEAPIEVEELRGYLADGVLLIRNPASRFSFIRQDGGVLLFVDGVCFECAGESAALAESLCAHECIALDATLVHSDAAMALIVQLFNQGSLGWDTEDDE